MSKNPEAERYAVSVLEKRKQNSASRTASMREEISRNVPDYEALEAERRTVGIQKIKASLVRDGDTVEKLSKRQAELKELIRAALARKGYDISQLEEFYRCPKCKDTGLLPDGSDCTCKKKLMADYISAKINEASPLSLSSFDTFSLEMYSDEKDEKLGISPRAIMRANYDKCIRFMNKFPKSGSMLMTGNSGLGKTHLALSIAKELIERQYYVIYCSAASVFSKIDGEKNDFSRESQTLEDMKDCDLLVLDDLGTEYVNASVVSVVYDLINTRINENRPTIITTNLTTQKLISARYGEKTTSRLFGCYDLLPFFGSDIRLKLNGFERN